MGHQFDETGVNEDTGRDGIENTVDNEGGLRSRGVGFPDTQTDGDGDGSAETVRQTEDVGSPTAILGPRRDGQSRSKTETFEGLMENEDDEEGVEFRAGHSQSETDEDAVEDDAEFQDKNGRHLSLVVLEAEWIGCVIDLIVFVLVAEVVLAGNMSALSPISHCCGGGGWYGGFGWAVFIRGGISHIAQLCILGSINDSVVAGVAMIVSIAKIAISCYHQLDEEEDKDRHQDDTLTP